WRRLCRHSAPWRRGPIRAAASVGSCRWEGRDGVDGRRTWASPEGKRGCGEREVRRTSHGLYPMHTCFPARKSAVIGARVRTPDRAANRALNGPGYAVSGLRIVSRGDEGAQGAQDGGGGQLGDIASIHLLAH